MTDPAEIDAAPETAPKLAPAPASGDRFYPVASRGMEEWPEASRAMYPAMRAQLKFTGSGAEYFRIWVLNTLLSLVTLGVYSAWAKIRKASYFARNTQLLGHTFDFQANPWAILRGRLIALVLFGLYAFASDFSAEAGMASVLLLLLLGPWLIRSANRFRLQNTRWRGIRFSFTASVREAYVTMFPVIALWIAGAVAGAFLEKDQAAVLGAIGIAQFILAPWMHHRFKSFQHSHVRFGNQSAAYTSAVKAFYLTYVLGLLIMALAFIAAALAAWGIVTVLISGFGLRDAGMRTASAVIIGGLFAMFLYLSAWPYFATRIQRAVWSHTTLGPLHFRTDVKVSTLWPLALRVMLMMLITLGLYWPFAAVAWARYRIECMTVESAVPLEVVASEIQPGFNQTSGEGALDIFGIDIGW